MFCCDLTSSLPFCSHVKGQEKALHVHKEHDSTVGQLDLPLPRL
jgi:hypothetical protein